MNTSPWVARLTLALLVVSVAFQVVTLVRLAEPKPLERPRWEHDIVTVNEPQLTATLASSGSQGWELVSVRRVTTGNDPQTPEWRVELVMKRQLLTPLRVE